MDEIVELSVAEILERRKREAEQGPWFPANRGTEKPFVTRTGHRVLYCWQPSTGRHAYLDMDTDLFIDDADLHLYGL